MSLTLSKVILKYQNNKILTEWIDIKCLSKKLSFLNRYELLPEVTTISTSKAKRLQYIINYAVPLLKKKQRSKQPLSKLSHSSGDSCAGKQVPLNVLLYFIC